MTRAQAISELLKVHRPLGPFGDPAEPDQKQEAWARTAGEDALDAVFDLATHPPDENEIGHLSPDQFEFEISRMLSLLGEQRQETFLRKAKLLLENSTARPTLIDALGMVHSAGSMCLLAALVDMPNLTEEEGIRLASALGELGGPEALEQLARLRDRTPEDRTAVIGEIDIAKRLISSR